MVNFKYLSLDVSRSSLQDGFFSICNMQVLTILISCILFLSIEATVPRRGLVLRHEKFNLKLIRPLNGHEKNTISFLETDEIRSVSERAREWGVRHSLDV